MFCVLRVIGLTALKFGDIPILVCDIILFVILKVMHMYTCFRWKNYFVNNGSSFVIFRVRLVRQMRPETF